MCTVVNSKMETFAFGSNYALFPSSLRKPQSILNLNPKLEGKKQSTQHLFDQVQLTLNILFIGNVIHGLNSHNRLKLRCGCVFLIKHHKNEDPDNKSFN